MLVQTPERQGVVGSLLPTTRSLYSPPRLRKSPHHCAVPKKLGFYPDLADTSEKADNRPGSIKSQLLRMKSDYLSDQSGVVSYDEYDIRKSVRECESVIGGS